MLCKPQGLERLCWSAWPCETCSGGVTTISHIFSRLGSGPSLQGATPEEIAKVQISWLSDWVGRCHHGTLSEILLPKLDEGSEHIVFLDASKARVFKRTRLGTFGESYYLEDGRISQRNCSPLDYLMRLRLWKKLFLSAPKDLGITKDGQIISTHKFITGTQPTQEETDNFLMESGLEPIKQQYWLWKKIYTEYEIWVGDARADNFVKTGLSIVPIDLRIWFMSPTQNQSIKVIS